MPSEEVLKLFDRAEVQAKLAKKFWVPCSDCGESGMELRGSPPRPQGGPCSVCQGSGRQYPLRTLCLRKSTALINPQHPKRCKECINGYLFNDAPDAIWDAVRAKRGDILISSLHDQPGNSIEVNLWDGGYGNVEADEGYQGQEALERVTLRALEAANAN